MNPSKRTVMTERTFFSPAKLNLFLRVLRKRGDGYHDLASLFQAIDFGDTLTFSIGGEDLLTCQDPTIPCDDTNLILKAASLFRQKTGLSFGVRVHLEKKVPVGAGLGGGSSNAATTLWALNQLHGFPAKAEQLAEWAREIGSDISFFFSRGTAYCTGRGENVRPLSHLHQKQPVSLLLPPYSLSTPEVYRHLDLPLSSHLDPQILLSGFLSSNPCYINDLEEPAFQILPSLRDLKQRLQAGGFESVMMTGSGTGFFCVGKGVYRELTPIPVHFIERQEHFWYGEEAT